MKSKTSILFHDPEWIFGNDDLVKHFINTNGSETEGTVYFPKEPIIIETNHPFTRVVSAVFTTVDEFIKNPPDFAADEIRKKGDNITYTDVVSILDAFAFLTFTNFHYTIFDDGVLVYSCEGLGQ